MTDTAQTTDPAPDHVALSVADEARNAELEILDRTIHGRTAQIDDPTSVSYSALLLAYDYFRKNLFQNKLPSCLITLQRHRSHYGYFHGRRFITIDGGKVTDEIAMNPSHFSCLTTERILLALAVSMVQLDQFHAGKAGRRNYKNKDFYRRLRKIGLEPLSTVLPDGKNICDNLDVLPDGPFARACRDLLWEGFTVPYYELPDDDKGADSTTGQTGTSARQRKNASKTKYLCPTCGCDVCAWGKPNLLLDCSLHRMRMVSEHAENTSSYQPAPAIFGGNLEIATPQ